MALYPILVEMENAPVLVAGGGHIALHKAQLFMEQGADVTVVAPEVCREIEELGVKIEKRKICADDAAGKMIVADATGDPEAEEMLSAVCKDAHIPYICAGHGELCTAVLPAVYSKGRTVVAVSSKGASPAASARLRDILAAYVPENMDGILDAMAECRKIAKESFKEQPVRREYLHRCLDEMLKTGKPISKEEMLLIRDNTI